MKKGFLLYRKSTLMYWALFVLFFGSLQRCYEAYLEFSNNINSRLNYTHLDFYIKTGCDICMFISCLIAERYPRLWNGVGIWWFFMFCVYTFFTSYLELYNFAEISLLAADLKCYFIMICLVLTNDKWIIEILVCNFLYVTVCSLMAYFANLNANKTCLSLGIDELS